MAVEYLNRIVALGAAPRVKEFRDAMRRTVDRKVRDKIWQDEVPFSLETLARITEMSDPEDYAYEPYDISVWPIRRISSRQVELRYQFTTRNLDMAEPLTLLSNHFPKLTFRFVAFCSVDGGVYGYRIRDGGSAFRHLSEARTESHWNAARKKFRLSGDDVWDDDLATEFAEERMREDLLNSWDPPGRIRRRRNWSDQPEARPFEDERVIAMVEISDAQDRKKAKARPRRRGKSKKKR